MPRPALGGCCLMTTTALATPEEPEPRKPRKARSRRRANGEGTIVQRKDGRYEAKVFVPTTAGSIKRVSVYGKTREECHAKYVKLKAQADDGVPIASVSWTVEQYLAYWLDNIVRVERRPKTVQGYESVIRLHLVPGLGKKRLGKLTAATFGRSSPPSASRASAAGTGGTPAGTSRAAAPSRAASAASPGSRCAWFSSFWPCSATPCNRPSGKRSSRGTSPASSRSPHPSTR
ncbi:hypothetical protein ABZ914_05635 [Spirillospora sp. NPDC046719]